MGESSDGCNMGMQGFNKTEQVWQLKWLPVTCLALNQQLSL